MSKQKQVAEEAIFQVADEAILQLGFAVKTIIQLETLFRTLRKELGEHSDAARLVALGEYAATDQGNGFDYMRETLRERLNVATQNEKSPNVPRASAEVVQ